MVATAAKVALVMAAAAIPTAHAFLPCSPMPLSAAARHGQCARATALPGLRMDGNDGKEAKGAGVQRRAILGGVLGAAAWTISGSPAEALKFETLQKIAADPSLLAIPFDQAKTKSIMAKYKRMGTPVSQISVAEAATYTEEYDKFVEAVKKVNKVKIGDAIVDNPTDAQLLQAWKSEELRRALERETKGQEPLTRPVKLLSEKTKKIEDYFLPPVVTKESSSEAEELGKHLQAIGATMYGAYWCSHCYGQKQALGKEVTEKYLKYVECDKKGAYNERDFCKEHKVPGFPTWEINGELFPGEKGLPELKAISGFGKPPKVAKTP